MKSPCNLPRLADNSDTHPRPHMHAIPHSDRAGHQLQAPRRASDGPTPLGTNSTPTGFWKAKQLATETASTMSTADITEPLSLDEQKDKHERDAIASWEKSWHEGPRTSLAYRTALTRPPDGKPHPTAIAQKRPTKADSDKRNNNSNGNNNTEQHDKFPRHITSTFYRFITGHAFTGEYTQRFHTRHTTEQVECQCGEPVQRVEHVLLACPLFDDARRRHFSARGRP
ncbi:hypothetical protein F5148DRAFT_1248903 [Russula earlei]|uniref:Uncharacterized protein n=1 Tax=Russula earlei TaxID=71964 RepID=A0ACC0TU24_9AGAM|nr:hypothetical protein F5148DRAFT_1248903 [Russula earlei]